MEISKEAKFQKHDMYVAQLYALIHKTFDVTLISTLLEKFRTHGYLSDEEYTSLRALMDQYAMDEWYLKTIKGLK